MNKVFVALLFALVICSTTAQQPVRYNTFNYNVNEGMLQSQIFDMAFDKYNFAWLSYFNGLQRFDGNKFVNIPLQAGLPDDKFINFFIRQDSNMLVASALGISEYDSYTGRFTLLYPLKNEKTSPIFIGEYKNKISLLSSKGDILVLDKKNFVFRQKGIDDFEVASAYGFNNSMVANSVSRNTCIQIDSIIYLFDLGDQKIIDKFESPQSVLTLKMVTNNIVQYVISTNKDYRLFSYNFKTKENVLITRLNTDAEGINRIKILQRKNGAPGFILSNHQYATSIGDPDYKQKELVNTSNQSLTNDYVFKDFKEDYYGNLYLLSIMNGFLIAYPNQLGIKSYSSAGMGSAFGSAVCADKEQNRVLFGTFNNGLAVYDTNQNLVKHIKQLPGRTKSFTPIGITSLGNNQFLLMCHGERVGWLLANDNIIKSIPISGIEAIEYGVGFYGNTFFDDKQVAYIQTTTSLFKIIKHPLQISYDLLEADLSGSCMYKGQIVTHNKDKLHFYDQKNKTHTTSSLPNTAGVRSIATDGNTIYVGSNKGLFVIDENKKLIKQYTKHDGLQDECIYAIQLDLDNNVWCSTNQGIFCIRDGEVISQIGKINGLQENEFNSNVTTRASNGELYFGGVKGLNSFYPFNALESTEKIKLVFTDVRINNKPYHNNQIAPWALKELELNYQQNSLSFEFLGMGKKNPTQNKYYYKMEGFDTTWTRNESLQPVRYHLQPGRYNFKISAASTETLRENNFSEIKIHISPPFWRTWWFIALLSLSILTLIYVFIDSRNKRTYKALLRSLEQEKLLAGEREKISRDLHDTIGAYANTLSYKTEIIEKEKDVAIKDSLIKDLRFVSKEIITSLRENIWALKKTQYTAGECMQRITNFMQALGKYYPHIHFEVHGQVPDQQTLHYSVALHVVRIAQEALANAIKHAAATNIDIHSNYTASEWVITIADNGQGFNLAYAEDNATGNGLYNMRHRALSAGIVLNINTNEMGTKVTLSIKLQNA